jgi:GNAT superfamily N-acetyltransferase
VTTFHEATPEDIADVVHLRSEAARDLARRFGLGHWSRESSDRAAQHDLKTGRVWLAREDGASVGTFKLSTRKPWAIDPAYFTAVKRPIYLTDMAVLPERQGTGIGRRCLSEIAEIARQWPPADAIWLDAYDAPAGAGGFYDRCGYREVGRTTYRGVPLVYYELLIRRHPEDGR